MPLFDIVEFAFHVFIVEAVEGKEEHFGRRYGVGIRSEGGKNVADARPFGFGFGRDGDGRQVHVIGELDGCCFFRKGVLPVPPEFFRGDGTNPVEHGDHAFERYFVVRIGEKFQEAENVLDVRLFKEAYAAGDAVGDFTAREFHLDFHAVEVRAVEDGDFRFHDSRVDELVDALADEEGLGARVGEGDEGGGKVAFRPVGTEFFWYLPLVGGNGGIGEGEDFRDAPVVGFDFKGLGTGVFDAEVEDVADVGSAP